jgi:biopolymer transport protein ExbB
MVEYFIKGGPVMYPLLACSILALTVVIERTIFWIREDLYRNQNLVDDVLELCRRGDWDSVRERVRGSRDYVIRILVNGVLHREYSMTKAMESATGDEIKRMRRFLGVLDTMITIAPLLGILGTVTGIITAFEHIQVTGMEQPQEVTAGIAQALITTAAGLFIAIPSLILYNHFNTRVENAALTIEKYSTSLEIVYEKLGQTTKGQNGVSS